MDSFENVCEKPVLPTASMTVAPLPGQSPAANPQKQIGREVAHELNNIFTILRGYADRMLMKHGQNPELRPDLIRLAENARRAELVVRNAPRLPAPPE